MKTSLKLLVSVLALSSLPAIAEDKKPMCDRVLFGGWSYHYDRSKDYNENHKLLGIQCRNVSLIRFKNSKRNTSVGLGYEHMPLVYKDFEFGAYAGLWTGYRSHPIAMPVAAGRVRYSIGPLGIVGTIGPALSAVHLEYRF